MEHFIEYGKWLVQGICPNSKIDASMDESGTILSFKGITKTDMPSVIGIQGETAKAIIRLCKVAAGLDNKRIFVKICEPE